MKKYTELLPCPFCGTNNDYGDLDHGTCIEPGAWWDSAMRGEKFGYVKCYECGCIIKANTEKDAIKIWNTRNGWIKCSERLPEVDGDDVLIVLYDNTIELANLTIKEWSGELGWDSHCWSIGETRIWDLGDVIYWMPIPKPPKSGF